MLETNTINRTRSNERRRLRILRAPAEVYWTTRKNAMARGIPWYKYTSLTERGRLENASGVIDALR